MADQILHEDSFYRLVAHGPLRSETTIVTFDIRRGSAHPVQPGPFADFFVPAHLRARIAANFVSVQTSRNCWYLDPALDAGLERLRRHCGGSRVVTYGSSMGGYAALNLGMEVGADLAVAISPLSTVFDPYCALIGDRRFPQDRQLLSPARDRLLGGAARQLRGLVLFDSTLAVDAAHASAIAAATRCDLVDVRHGGHPVGRLFNRLYPLGQLLADVAEGPPPLAAIRDTLARKLPSTPEAMAADPAQVEVFHDLCRDALDTLRPMALLNAALLAQRMPQSQGPDPAARLARLIAWLGDRRMDWTHDPPKRALAALALCEAATAAGQRDLASACAKAHLPPAQWKRFSA